MKFEHVLGFYWAQSFLFNGFLKSPLIRPFNIISYFKGLGHCVKQKLLIFLESNKFLFSRYSAFRISKLTYLATTNDTRIRINQFLSRLGSLNYSFDESFSLNVLQKILLKSYRGRSFLAKRPTRGQRTRSNWRNSKKMCGRGHLLLKLVRKRTPVEVYDHKTKKKYRYYYAPFSSRLRVKKRLNKFFFK